MHKIILLFLFLITLTSFSQTTKKFASIATQEVTANAEGIKEIRENFQVFVGQNGVDQLDVDIIYDKAFFVPFMMKITTKKLGDKISYQDVLDAILEFKKETSFQNIRKIYPTVQKLEKKPADIQNWEEDKLLLEKLGIPKRQIAEIHAELKKNTNPSITYKEFLNNLQKKK
ncbi:hypothetical protein [Aureivirga marina]|uniref:hypothetical protein n=1 Tax=Aureivirga marina TaxID=1182451 RepID=UPI0018CAEFC5|nr:hypothetical protein [Aureivirga marina]